MMKTHQLKQAIKHWDYIAPLVAYPKNEKAFNQLVSDLDQLLDIVGKDEKHPLIGLIDIISDLITTYESNQETKQISRKKGIDALKFLMEANQLGQADLPEIASQGVLSEILNGKRLLNLRQIKLLAKRFHVDPATFIDN